MSEQNETVFREHFEQIWNRKDASAIDRFIAPTYVGYDAEEVISGLDGYKQHFLSITTAFPDMRISIELLLSEGERVAARWLVQATHRGPLGEIPPTGRRVRITGIAIVRIVRGRLIEEHANSDTLGLLKQIGEIPPSVRAVPLLF